MQTDTRPTPEPLNVRKERAAAEGQAAWTHYRAEQDAVNKNMERLRAAVMRPRGLAFGGLSLFPEMKRFGRGACVGLHRR